MFLGCLGRGEGSNSGWAWDSSEWVIFSRACLSDNMSTFNGNRNAWDATTACFVKRLLTLQAVCPPPSVFIPCFWACDNTKKAFSGFIEIVESVVF